MRRLLALAISWCWLSACNGGSDPIPLADLPAQLVAVDCAAQVRCNLFPSVEVCRQALTVRLEQVKADVASGKVKYDPSAAGDCLGAIAGLSCNLSDGNVELPACQRTYQVA